MKQFFKKTIKKHIEILKFERMEIIKTLMLYCSDTSFRYVFLNLELKWLEFKITIWETIINE